MLGSHVILSKNCGEKYISFNQVDLRSRPVAVNNIFVGLWNPFPMNLVRCGLHIPRIHNNTHALIK